MRGAMLFGAGILGCSLLAPAASAGVVAHYGGDFTTSGAPKTGWAYQWNAASPIESAPNILNTAGLVNLVRDTSGNFETVANAAYPDPAPGVGLAATKTSMFPGQSASEAADGISRWTIASYTIQASDVAANGHDGILDTYSFAVPASSTDGVSTRIYLNGFRIVTSPLPGNFTYDQNSPGAFPIPFGSLNAGDVIAVGMSAGTASTGDRLDLDYTITLTPEPGSLLLGVAGIGLLARRRAR